MNWENYGWKYVIIFIKKILNKMAEKDILKLRVYTIKTSLRQISTDIKIYLNNKPDFEPDFEKFKIFQNKYKLLTNNFHQIIDKLIPLC